jgi:serine/threonine protein kinase
VGLPTRIAGKYRVTKALGEGSTAVVLEAVHEAIGQKVAVKLLREEALDQAEAVARFQREARIAAQVPGDHVARVMDFGQAETGQLYLVFEHLEGRDLQAELEARGSVPVREAVDWVLQACAGVAEAHALGLVHRDLKPANLFLAARRDGSPCVKVLDFGVAKALLESEHSQLTGAQTKLGTPLYASPEQLRSLRDATAQSDQHALAAILYALVVGRPPFVGPTLAAVFEQILGKPAARASSVKPGLPSALDAVLERALAKQPKDRYPDVFAFASALAPLGSPSSKVYVSEAQRALAGKRELDDDELATVVAKPLSADEAAALVSKPRGGKSRSIVQGAPLVLDDTTVADSRPRFSEDEPDDPTQVYRPAKKAKGASAKGPGGESPLARLAAVAVPQLTVPHARGGPGRAGPQQRAKAPPPPEPPEPDPVQVFRTPRARPARAAGAPRRVEPG